MKLRLFAPIAFVVTSIALASACSSDEEGDGAQTSGTGGKGGSAGSSAGRGGTSTGGSGGVGGTGGSGGGAGCNPIAVPCDGPEDCPTGNLCCGHFVVDVDNYVEFQCLPSCGSATTDGGGQELWLELCHPGQTCEDPTYQCSSSTYLPSSLYRCYDTGADAGASGSTTAGEINCGTSTCTSDQKCCIGTSGEPFCTAKSATCGCTPPVPDAGSAGSGGGDDASVDAATDAEPDGAAGRRNGPP